MRRTTLRTCLLATLIAAATAPRADADPGKVVDVVHFWVSHSESAALDVFRKAWKAAGNQWADMPAENKVAVQRAVSDRIANGYAPAVMQWNANEGSRELPEMGIVLDIDEVARSDRWSDVLPAAVLDRISYNEKVYFAPAGIHAENWLWTNRALFAAAGLPLPQSWDDIFAAAAKIKAAGRLPFALGGGGWEISLIFNNILYDKLGPESYARIISGDASAVMDPRVRDALAVLRRISLYAEPRSARQGKTWADATAAVGSGAAAMQFMGDWAKGELVARGYSADTDFDCNLAPGTEIAYFMVIDAFAFPLTNRDDAANAQRAFARMLLDRDNQVAFSRIKGSLPVRTDVNPAGLDHCGQLGLKMIAQNSQVSAQSMAMPSQMSEGWIAVLAEFFDDHTLLPDAAQQRLVKVVSEG
ncbi:ABC transporter substrate-binding protein [Rhizobium sp. TRM95111]|uniref:ABC transporter substrate-binding protein n=1 Tax=Rhizobium alarense TaxID=2846851 RepID=UPI001F20A5B7|nr:ABC transporter substrate-binding protein [Rhizobium alarense]MCF3642405.1 ABC transporter substrate-binding protein [Rhizobium alarense]